MGLRMGGWDFESHVCVCVCVREVREVRET